MKKTAIVIGATGLVGSKLIEQLLNHEDYKYIVLLTRRPLNLSNEKIKEYIIDFDDVNSYREHLQGDVLFSTMGTTIKQAGSKEAQYRVDYTYQFNIAKEAAENGIKKYVLVSSAGADKNARFFYMRMKGELDEAVRSLPFTNISIIRPATLIGERTEKRTGEDIAIKVTNLIARLIPGLKKYQPIPAETVASAMINAAKSHINLPYRIYAYKEVFQLAEKHIKD